MATKVQGISEFDRTTLQHIRQVLDKALRQCAEDLEIGIRLGNCTYSPRTTTFKLELTTVGKNGQVETKEAKDFKRYASLYDLKPSDLGKYFTSNTSNGIRYKLVGCKPQSHKYPIIGQRNDGKRFKFDPDNIAMEREI